jgi:ribosomal protein L31
MKRNKILFLGLILGFGILLFQMTYNNQISLAYDFIDITEVVSTESTEDSKNSDICVDVMGNIHIVWQDSTNYSGAGTDIDIFYKRYDSITNSWGTTQIISNESNEIDPGDAESAKPDVEVDENLNVYIVWQEEDPDFGAFNFDICLKMFNSSTESWSTTELISTDSTTGSYSPHIAIDSNMQLHVVWIDATDLDSDSDTDVFYRCHNQSSGIWNGKINSTDIVSNTFNDSDIAKIDVDTYGNIHVVWEDETNYTGEGNDKDIFYRMYNETTDQWNNLQVISTGCTDYSGAPEILVDKNQNVHVVWEEATDLNGPDLEILYRFLNTSNGIWNPFEIVSIESTEISGDPTIAVDNSGNVHVAWIDQTPFDGRIDNDIFYKVKNSSNQKWGAYQIISEYSWENSNNPSMVIDESDNVHIIWYVKDYLPGAGTEGDLDIFYIKLEKSVQLNPPSEPKPLFTGGILDYVVGISGGVAIGLIVGVKINKKR